MSLYSGNNELRSAYVGTDAVSRIYLGNTLIWSSGAPVDGAGPLMYNGEVVTFNAEAITYG